MSRKRKDDKNRWRNKTIAFRVSPEEDELIDTVVKMLGITKQSYLTTNMLKHTIKLQPNVRMLKGLKETLNTIIEELKRIEAGKGVDSELLFTIDTAVDIYRQAMGIKKNKEA